MERISLRTKTEPGSPPKLRANALSALLRSGISAMIQSVSNVESGDNFIPTTEGGLALVADRVNRGRENWPYNPVMAP
jgi:hypothetical protein